MTLLSSLTNRIFLASALLVVAAMGIAVWRVTASVSAQAERDLEAGLNESASLVDRLNRTDFDDFVLKSELIADLPKLKGAVATEDPPTVVPIAAEYQRRAGADLFVVLDRSDRVLAQSGRIQVRRDQVPALLRASRTGQGGTAFWPQDAGLLHVAAVPIEPGLGTLLAGVSLDQEAVLRIRAFTNSEIALISGGRLLASTLTGLGVGDLAPRLNRSEVFTLTLHDAQYVARAQRLGGDATPAAPVAVVLRSRTEHLRFLPSLRMQIALTGLAAVLVATVVGYLVARTVTRPLRALTGAMSDMATTGDLTRALPALGPWDDEDVRLVATTFHQLTSALDHFQREAAEKERLSSLGRLSTVVAHEIRNPLMIMKAAVRRLRRHPAPDVADLASNIDEEVGRLNQVVSGVLDFARPVSVTLAPVRLDDICRDAAQAARTEADDVPIEATTEAATVVTDAERLRAVLVNILTNAQHAVRARRVDAGAVPPVALHLSPLTDGWRVTVRDEGIGVQPEDLPRVFDPFFTTRRTGSGLGLAIARNVVGALGGTIAMESRWGAGTTVTIDLPGRASPAARES